MGKIVVQVEIWTTYRHCTAILKVGISENEMGMRAKLTTFKWLINCKQLFYDTVFMHPPISMHVSMGVW